VLSVADDVSVEVTDNGVGLDRSAARRSGLANLEVRARRRGGSFGVQVGESGGTRVHWTVPLP
ncbi:histidine kinase, partial [Nocardia sp. NPDC004722]